MTHERELAVAYLGVAAAGAIAVNSTAGLALVALSLLSLIFGYRRKWGPSTAAVGLFLYYPVAISLGRVVPGGWNYAASAVLLIILSESLSFEYQLSTALDVPFGVDEESRVLTAKLSKSHGVKLVLYAGGAIALSAASVLATVLTRYPPLLPLVSVLLVFALWAYTRS